MSDFENAADSNGFRFKLWRGERMTMIGFDVAAPEDDFVGFAIEVKSPKSQEFVPLRNRLNFSYPQGAAAVTGDRLFPTDKAPIQKFRWIHFPYHPVDGTYEYRATKIHMPRDGDLVQGTRLDLGINQHTATYDGVVDIGFTRNFASSQAYREQFGNNADVIPKVAIDGLDFKMLDLKNDRGENVYDWLGFEARQLLYDFLDEAVADPAISVDFLAYDLNLPDVVAKLTSLGGRLRAVIDDSSSDDEDGNPNGHDLPTSCESRSADRLTAAGAAVRRTHFHNLQHHKVLIQRHNGVPVKVLCGSTNYSFRGLYIQANNVLVFTSADVAGFFGTMFDMAFSDPMAFRKSAFAKTWHAIPHAGGPTVQLCFSPHSDTDLSLNPIAAAIDQATSCALYSLAFLNMMRSGPTLEAFERLIDRPIFSCGSVDKRGSLHLIKPDGSRGLVDFRYLSSKAPEPFKSEWSGGKGRNVHHKFLVTDFNLPTAKVFTGSSNMSPSGEKQNGDHLIMIEDRKIATAYAIEAIRVFDHLQFRNRMYDADHAGSAGHGSRPPETLSLRKPTAISGKPAWFEKSYVSGSQAERDRLLFSK
ncbi:PLD-like domain-containing protein [Rhizobium sp. RU35A]|uniref:phospholipase D-like domain-containing protein n=1 Tax=Rhizobium sp. RU35A TaxID=1907414 RepID=UPI00095707B0|nr:phospholipase D-like domain-containing protein [Rhizobium sp. RU35A]SIR41879.1 PLD-like domain-containing protein [Rhizobium sp. RU35A]